MNAEEQTRYQCLNEAVRSCNYDNSAAQIVATAQKFFEFVTGKKAKPAPKKTRR